jgi:hypothetical protein
MNSSDTSVRQLGSDGCEGFGIDVWRRVSKGISVRTGLSNSVGGSGPRRFDDGWTPRCVMFLSKLRSSLCEWQFHPATSVFYLHVLVDH